MVSICAKCGTDQVAELDWQHPYEAGEHYPAWYCVECGPYAVMPDPDEDPSERVEPGHCACGHILGRHLDGDAECALCNCDRYEDASNN